VSRRGDRLPGGAARGGAQALQVFDTWGGALAPHHYREFSLRYLQRIARSCRAAKAPIARR
jgi:uroporphyrinogen-III decarboxylase